MSVVLPALLTGCAKHDDGGVDAAVTTLASTGVGVYESYGATGPIQAPAGTRSAMRFTRWQLRSMLAQADAGMGMLGADIDRLEGAKAPKHAPTFSTFIAAWLVRGSSPLAQYAKGLMRPKSDYKHAAGVTFPLLVITLFIADAARVSGTGTAPPKHGFNFERLIAAPAAASGICSTVSSFINTTITDVTNALQISGGGFFASLWNVAVELVAGLAKVLINNVLVPLLSILTLVAGGLALITTIASTLQPWTVSMEENPQSVTLGANPVQGTFTAVLHAPSIDWPSEVADCAQVLGGVDLTKINSKDAPVTWQTFGELGNLATVDKKAGTVGNENRADLSYSTATHDTTGDQCGSLQAIGYLGARAYVQRQDILHLQQQLLNLVLGQLPGFVRDHLMPLFQPWINSAMSSFNNLLATPVMGTGTTELWEVKQDPLKCKPPPAVPSPTPKPAPSTNVDDTKMVGSWACTITQTANTAIGPITVTVHAYYKFTKGGLASGGTSMDAAFPNPNDVHKVSAGNNPDALVGGTGPYTYDPTTEILHVDGHDRHLTWSGSNAFSMSAESPVSHKAYTMHCNRK